MSWAGLFLFCCAGWAGHLGGLYLFLGIYQAGTVLFVICCPLLLFLFLDESGLLWDDLQDPSAPVKENR